MSRKEQIIKLIKGEKPDYTPHHFDLTLKMTDRLGKYYGYDRDGVEDYIGNHFLYLDPTEPEGVSGFRSTVDGHFKDEFGVVWDAKSNYDIGDWGMVSFPIKDFDFSNYVFPDGKGEGRYEKASKLMEKYPGRFNVMRITGPFTQSWHLTGIDEFFVGMMIEKETAHMVFERVTEYICNLISSIPKGVDAVRILDDWGFQDKLMFSKDIWMEYVYPSLKTIFKVIRDKGMYVMIHSCGHVMEVIPELIELGTDILDPIQPEANDTAFIKKEYGKDIVLFGGLGSQSTIPTGTREDVIAEAEEILKVLGEGGKYIIGPAGSIPSEAPIENVAALVEFCKELKEKGI